ncbi:hypothetical protein WJX73_005080 [Symbiochloris irregularis]|uniref:Uncharacterized protein n=1 Tax=Symbiochloris irregularis TaxID=706552 RepID=A0AAW1PNH8_9CHLO
MAAHCKRLCRPHHLVAGPAVKGEANSRDRRAPRLCVRAAQGESSTGASSSTSTAEVAAPARPGKSPFGSSGGLPSSSQTQPRQQKLFADSKGSKNPFDNPSDLWKAVEPMESDDRPWWQKVTFGQVALGASFLLVIVLMFGTFYVTVKLGAVSFND